ncbi:MAG: hypothetical protein QOE96_501 [Blastocatellia bacterium]|jgi:hypothetical protein|nr:hypothetical protein [Blastocatellia bacterium]
MGDNAAASWESVLKLVGGVGAVFAVIGYGSLRTWFNYLGIRDVASLPASIYLFEAYLFISAAIAVLAPIFVLFVLISCVIATLLPGKNKSMQLEQQRAFQYVRAFVPAVIPVALIIIAVIVLRGSTDGVLLDSNAVKKVQTTNYGLFALTVLLTVIMALVVIFPQPAAWASQIFGTVFGAACRAAGGIAALVLLWSSIVVFNVLVKPLSFSVASVYLKSVAEPPLCGLLVLMTDSEYITWNYLPETAPKGAFVVSQRSDARELRIGQQKKVSDFVTLTPVNRCGSAGPSPPPG